MDWLYENPNDVLVPEGYKIVPMGSLSPPHFTMWMLSLEQIEDMKRSRP